MRILLLFTYNISLEIWDKNGILNREVSLYKRLSRNNIKYIFMTYGGISDLNYSKQVNDIKIIPVKKLIKSKNNSIKFLKAFLLPLKLRKEFQNVDIIKTNQLDGSWVTFLAKLIFKKKIIIRGGFEQLRNFLASHKLKNLNYFHYLFEYIKIYLLEFIAYKIADAIILTSTSDIQFIIKAFNLKKQEKKIHHLSNFIDINLFKSLDIIKKEKSILFIGRLHPEKNLINLLKALKELNGFSLTIIGDGPLKTSILNYKENFNLDINYLGVIPNPQLPKIINQHQIFILPSLYEGTPKVLLESMSCGTACIGTNVRGINNIIEHKENGYLCNTDAESIKQAIKEVYINKELRDKMEKSGREYIISNCSLDSISNKEYVIYKNLLRHI